MTDFARTMIAGLLLLAGVLAIAGTSLDFDISGDSDDFQFGPVGDGDSRFERRGEREEGIFVGTTGIEDFSRIRFGDFSASRLKMRTEQVSFDDLWVSKGVAGDRSKTSIFRINDTGKIKGAVLQGFVEDTNQYGKLIIRLNGETVVADGFEPGDDIQRAIPADLLRNGSNKLSITASSSTWRVWAPTVYITDINLHTAREGEVAQRLGFSIPRERVPPNSGRFVFNAESNGKGNLIIQVNGEEVYNDVPTETRLNLVDFRGDLLKRDNNAVFRATSNAKFHLKDAHLIYFFDRGPETNSSRSFELTSNEHDQLPGTVSFRISRVIGEPTGLSVDVVGANNVRTRIVPQGVLQAGNRVSVEINRQMVGIGENEIVFIVEGNGGFKITDFRVRP